MMIGHTGYSEILFTADQTINIQYKQLHVTKVTYIHNVPAGQANNSCINRMRSMCVHVLAPISYVQSLTCVIS